MSFDIHDCVKRIVRERQVFGIAVHEIQAGQLVVLAAVGDAVRVVVQSGVFGGLERADDVRCAAAMTATALQYLFAREVDLAGDLVVQVDRVPVGCVVLVQRKVQWRVTFIPVVEEGDVLGVEPPGQERVPDLSMNAL